MLAWLLAQLESRYAIEAAAMPIQIGRLVIRDLAVRWEDRTTPLTLSVEGINLELNPARKWHRGTIDAFRPSAPQLAREGHDDQPDRGRGCVRRARAHPAGC